MGHRMNKTTTKPRDIDPLNADSAYTAPDSDSMTYRQLLDELKAGENDPAYDYDQPVRLLFMPDPPDTSYYRLRLIMLIADDAGTDGRMVPELQLDYTPRTLAEREPQGNA